MSQLDNLVGKKFNHWTVLQELRGGKVICQCDCENKTIKTLDKYSVKSGKSSSCGCVKAFKKLEGQTFGYWKVLYDIDKDYAFCECICKTQKKVQKGHLKDGTSISCGCMTKPTIKNNLVGKTINYYTVLEELGGGEVIAQCVCGKKKKLYKDQLISGRVKSCGCMSSQLKSEAFLVDLVGKTINDWTILEELGKGQVRCRCICGNEKVVQKANIINNTSKSCGHNLEFIDLTNKQFGSWTVLKEYGYGKVACRCKCGKISIIDKQTLLRGASKSCGCEQYKNFRITCIDKYGETTANKISNPREKWQIDAVSSEENFIKFVTDTYKNTKPTIYDLTIQLGVNEASIGRIIKKFNAQEYVDIKPLFSKYEKQIIEYIQSISNCKILNNVRNIISNELDIYIPEKKIAIEFNGDYWHSNIFKDRMYHQNKTIECAKRGIRLIHIFEYEWKDPIKHEKILNILKMCITNKSSDIKYARKLNIKDVSNEDSKTFLNKYHLQGYVKAEISLGLYEDDELVQLITFGKPRFNSNYQYELIRMCTKANTIITGGFDKILKYFIDKYNPDSIISYIDISKFTGNSYLKLGFVPIQPNPITDPNYVWINLKRGTILHRYQTQKSKLLESGLGRPEQTEDEIMENIGFIKIYDSGNLKLQWAKGV